MAVQFLIMGLILFGPRHPAGGPYPLPPGILMLMRAGGLVLMVSGGIFFSTGVIQLGRHLTPFITPRPGGVLIEVGAYRLVRHPIYSGILQAAFGLSFWMHGEVTFGLTLLLAALFTAKARREEQILAQLYPDYRAYCTRVHRFLPTVGSKGFSRRSR